MYNYYRLLPILIFACIAGSIALQTLYGFVAALPFYIAVVLLLISYQLFGKIWSAFRSLKAGSLELAEMYLEKVNEKILPNSQKAYYLYVKGMLKIQQEEGGTKELEEALQLNIRNPTDRSMIHLNLAHFYAKNSNKIIAKKHLQEIKNLNPNDMLLKERAKVLEEHINKSYT